MEREEGGLKKGEMTVKGHLLYTLPYGRWI